MLCLFGNTKVQKIYQRGKKGLEGLEGIDGIEGIKGRLEWWKDGGRKRVTCYELRVKRSVSCNFELFEIVDEEMIE